MKVRNKIACSAERLGLLDPQMIQSVAENNAFHIGSQYATENRVRIVEAGDAQISSAVIGNSGLYEQNIKLKDGHLISKCSCTLPEEPMCRHCIAVLLEYHRWTQLRQAQTQDDAQVTGSLPPSASPSQQKLPLTQRSAPDIKLSEIMVFVEWLGPAMQAIEQGAMLPEPPPLSPGEVATWIHHIRNLEDRCRASHQLVTNLQSEQKDREAYLERLSQQLQVSIAEAKSAQAMSQSLQHEVAEHQEAFEHVTKLIDQVTRTEREIRSSASDLLAKSTNLDKLTGSFHELTTALKSASNQASHK